MLNKTNKKSTISESNGHFKLIAKLNDTILFSAINLEVIEIKVTEDDLKKENLQIKMNARSNQIEKIFISSKTIITPENLGLVPKNQKRYSVAERRMVSNQINTISIGALVNFITGYDKELKRNLEVEKKEDFKTKILNQFDENFIMAYLKIPKENVNGFLFYICEDKTLIETFKNKDKQLQLFKLSEAATQYLNTIK